MSRKILIPDSLGEYHDDVVGYALGYHWAGHADHDIAQRCDLPVEEVRHILTTVEKRLPSEPSHSITVNVVVGEISPAEVAEREAIERRAVIRKEHGGGGGTPSDEKDQCGVKRQGRGGAWVCRTK